MQWRRSCSSGNYQPWQNRNQTQHIDNHHSATTQWGRRSLLRGRRPYLRWLASTLHRSWRLCTYAPSSTSSPWTSSCTPLSPTFRSWPVIAIYPTTPNQNQIKSKLKHTFFGKKIKRKKCLEENITILNAIAMVVLMWLKWSEFERVAPGLI